MHKYPFCKRCGKQLYSWEEADEIIQRQVNGTSLPETRIKGDRLVSYKCPYNKYGYHLTDQAPIYRKNGKDKKEDITLKDARA